MLKKNDPQEPAEAESAAVRSDTGEMREPHDHPKSVLSSIEVAVEEEERGERGGTVGG